MGKVPAAWKLDKAHRCHLRGTEVIENWLCLKTPILAVLFGQE